MYREKQLNRMEKIVTAASKCFWANGYRQTQMADIAKEAAVSAGSIYNYFSGKEALFHFLIRVESLQLPPEQWPEIPIPAPKPRATLKLLEEESRKIVIVDALEAAIARDECPDPSAELEAIVRQFFEKNCRYRALLTLVERSVADWPELANVLRKNFSTPTRSKLKEYLDKRISQGLFRQVPDTYASARLITTLVNWFAKQRPYSLDPNRISRETAEETVVHSILHTFIPGAGS